jgi:hypothetical protein
MRNVLLIGVAVASVLTMAEARAEGDGLAANADQVPWGRFQSRVAYSLAAPGWRAELAPADRSGLQVGSLGVLGDMYFGGQSAERFAPTGFRATSGVLVGARSTWLGTVANSSSGGLLRADRRLFGPSATALSPPADPTLDSATVPYFGIGYSNLSARSGWHFSADLGVVSQSPGNVVRFGRVLGGAQGLDDVIRDMRLAPVIQLGVSYSF